MHYSEDQIKTLEMEVAMLKSYVDRLSDLVSKLAEASKNEFTKIYKHLEHIENEINPNVPQ